jgi:hypothetical protein
MAAGAPVRKRDNGFANDMGALSRLRTALKIDRKLDPNLVAKAIRPLDELIEQLGILHESVMVRKDKVRGRFSTP